jgi:hypothetical protein
MEEEGRAQNLASAVAVHDDIHSWPVDRCPLVVDRICRSKEQKHQILGHANPVPVEVEKMLALVLQGEREVAPSPHTRRTCIQSEGVSSSERAISGGTLVPEQRSLAPHPRPSTQLYALSAWMDSSSANRDWGLSWWWWPCSGLGRGQVND